MSLGETKAKSAIMAVNRALKEGYKPPNISLRRGEKGAIAIAAKSLNMNSNTLRSRLDTYFREYNLEPNWELWQEPKPKKIDPKIQTDLLEAEKKILSLQYENLDLKKKLNDVHRTSLDEDAIKSILGGIYAKGTNPPEWIVRPTEISGKNLPEVPVAIWSDWHGGERVSFKETNGFNQFNFDILEERVRRLVEKTIDICRNHGPGTYPGIIINLLGDFVSGSIHPELAKTDEEEVIPTSLRVSDLLIWSLTRIIEEFGQVYVPCVAGNHGRHTVKPEFKRYVFKNFDWLIYQIIYRHFKDNNKIIFDIPESNEVHYTVYGQRYLAMHGDMLGVKGGDGIIGAIGPIARGEFKVGRQSSSMGLDYDMLLIGHWHQQLWLPRVIVANSLIGFNEYGKNVLRVPPTIASQPIWFVHPHYPKTNFMEIYLEDPKHKENTEWLTFQKAIMY